MIFSDYASSPMPGSLPELSSSKSSKSSSFNSSYQSDDNTILSYLGNFEEIGLDDDDEIRGFTVKQPTTILNAPYASDLEFKGQKWRKSVSIVGENREPRELIKANKKKIRALPSVHVGSVKEARGLNLLPSRTRGISPAMTRKRSVSIDRTTMTNVRGSPNAPSVSSTPERRAIWQVNRERKTVEELEKECDDDDGDDVPDGCFLENVPLSPRALSRRSKTFPGLISNSSIRGRMKTLEKSASTCSLRQRESCPRLNATYNSGARNLPISPDHLCPRPKSWCDAMSDLGVEAIKLTEALEEFQEESDKKNIASYSPPEKLRMKASLTELPPLRKTNIMIDPLPISREKEAVLSRTRPSWLPPKDPIEEKRHLKEYRKIMALSMEADRKKEAENREKIACRDDTVSSLLRIWEEQVLPNWDSSIRRKHTRELWWKGITPRCRGRVWKKAIGNELGLSDVSYSAALHRAEALEKSIESGAPLTADEERKKRELRRIHLDVKKTYPELKIFQADGPLHAPLLDILKAYAMYRSDVGYIRGINTSAALLLLNLPTPTAAFIALSNLLNRPLPLSFHTSDTDATQRAFSLLFYILSQKSPKLCAHLKSRSSKPSHESLFIDFFTSMGTANLSLENATRLWDIMLFEGDAVLVRGLAAYLMSIESKLFSVDTFQQMVEITKDDRLDDKEDDWVNSIRRVY